MLVTDGSDAPSPEGGWRVEATIGTLLVLNAMPFGISHPGPWGDEGFTRGVGGLIGFALLYRAWFMATFNRRGIIPSLHLWGDPTTGWPKVLAAGVVTLALAWMTGGPLATTMPGPTGLLLTLFGCLICLVAIYAALVSGPLSDSAEEE